MHAELLTTTEVNVQKLATSPSFISSGSFPHNRITPQHHPGNELRFRTMHSVLPGSQEALMTDKKKNKKKSQQQFTTPTISPGANLARRASYEVMVRIVRNGGLNPTQSTLIQKSLANA